MFGGSAHNRVSVTPQGSCLPLTSVRRVGDTRPSRTPGNRGDGPWLASGLGQPSCPFTLRASATPPTPAQSSLSPSTVEEVCYGVGRGNGLRQLPSP